MIRTGVDKFFSGIFLAGHQQPRFLRRLQMDKDKFEKDIAKVDDMIINNEWKTLIFNLASTPDHALASIAQYFGIFDDLIDSKRVSVITQLISHLAIKIVDQDKAVKSSSAPGDISIELLSPQKTPSIISPSTPTPPPTTPPTFTPQFPPMKDPASDKEDDEEISKEDFDLYFTSQLHPKMPLPDKFKWVLPSDISDSESWELSAEVRQKFRDSNILPHVEGIKINTAEANLYLKKNYQRQDERWRNLHLATTEATHALISVMVDLMFFWNEEEPEIKRLTKVKWALLLQFHVLSKIQKERIRLAYTNMGIAKFAGKDESNQVINKEEEETSEEEVEEEEEKILHQLPIQQIQESPHQQSKSSPLKSSRL